MASNIEKNLAMVITAIYGTTPDYRALHEEGGWDAIVSYLIANTPAVNRITHAPPYDHRDTSDAMEALDDCENEIDTEINEEDREAEAEPELVIATQVIVAEPVEEEGMEG